MARPKGIPHTKEWKEEMSKKMKGKKSHPNSLKALKDNRGDRTGLTAWNKGLTFNYKSKKYNFNKENIELMISKKMTLRQIADIYESSISALYNFINKYNIKANDNYEQHQKESLKQKMREKRLKQKFNNKETDIEIKMKEILKQLKIPFVTQKNIMNRTLVDFFIEPNICIYCDGDYWHNIDYVKERDEKINQILKLSGYKVYRFTGTQIKKDTNHTIIKVQEAIL